MRSSIRLTAIVVAMLVPLLSAGPALAAGPTVTTGQASNIFATTAVLNGSVDSSLPVTSCHFTYGPDPSLIVGAKKLACQFVSNSDGVYVVLNGLSPLTKYYYQLSAANAAGMTMGSTLSFTTTATPPPPPTAATDQATAVTATSATLNGTVNAEQVAVTGCKFEYGTSTSYGQTASCSPPPTSSKYAQQESAAISGLTDGTEYHFQIVFSTEAGTTDGGDQTFVATGQTNGSAVGSATTGQPTAITATSATLNGTVNAGGQSGDTCSFYYGAGASGTYQVSVPCSTESVSGDSDQAESAGITGLKPDTQYHYTIALTSASGPVHGSPVAFTTLAGPTASTRRARHVTSNSAVLNGVVNPEGQPVTACFFQYARSRFGSTGSAPASARRARCKPSPSGSRNVAVKASVSHLVSGARYYFRVVLETRGGTASGSALSLRTGRAKAPGVRITRVSASRVQRSASFRFRATRLRATRFECALAVLRGGRLGHVHYSPCRSPKTYRGLRAGRRYEFIVRAGNRSGFGAPARRRVEV